MNGINYMKKIKLPSEAAYLFSLVILSLAVAMISATDFGVSMIAAPAFILSAKTGMSFGQCEYIMQGLLFVVMCILLKKVRLLYFSSFITGFVYGLMLDMWRIGIPHFNPSATEPGSLPMTVRLVYYIVGMIMTSFAIALFFRTYLYPQVYDFFVKAVTVKYKLNRNKFKIIFDFSCLAAAVLMTLLMFGRFVGIGIGTLVMTVLNGLLISLAGKILDRFFTFEPIFKKFALKFDIV